MALTRTEPYRRRIGRTWYYRCPAEIRYYSERYGEWVVVPEGRWSDGATGALDLWTRAWWVHDEICRSGRWHSGSRITNWQASAVISDILREEGRWIRACVWLVFTFLLGGGHARRNGMLRVRRCGDGT